MPETQTETKRIPLADFQWKSDGEPEGAFVATFATLNVIDHHGDVTLPGAFVDGKAVAIGGYQHDMMALPVGKAIVHADDTHAWVEGTFNLKSQAGRDTYETIKALQDVLEWSYIFRVEDWSEGDFETDKGAVPVRFLKKLDVWSVDPVLKGAGIDTGTDSIKSITQTFAEQAAALVTAVDLFAKRVDARIEMRAKDGRALSADDRTRIASLVTGLDELQKRLAEAVADPSTNDDSIDIRREFLAFQRNSAVLDDVLASA